MERHLSQYKIFYEVAKAGNISKAAKELFISQPAISKSISKLEHSLGIELFTRNSRGVQLTEEGTILYHHTQAAFANLDQGERELKRMKEFHMGHLRIGVSNTLCKYILLPYLKEFIQEYPHIKITIESQPTTHTINMLEKQQIDIGLIAKPSGKKPIIFLPHMDIEDIFVCTQSYLDHLYVREGTECDIFQAGNIMLLDRNNITRKYIDDYMKQNNISLNQLLEVTTMDLLIEFSRIGLGIGCVIKELIQEDLNNKNLVEVPLSLPIPRRTIGFAYHTACITKTMENFLQFTSRPIPLSGTSTDL